MLVTRDDEKIKPSLESLDKNNVKATFIKNKGRSILEGRRRAFFNTDASHVSYVDDDDLLLVDYSTLLGLCQPTPIFTNSEYRRNTEAIYQQNKKYTNPCKDMQWSRVLERERIFHPHQILIYPTEIAKALFTEAEKLIISKNWTPSDIDFVMRLMCSNTIGWKYINLVTYVWNLNSDNNSIRRDKKLALDIRKYFDL